MIDESEMMDMIGEPKYKNVTINEDMSNVIDPTADEFISGHPKNANMRVTIISEEEKFKQKTRIQIQRQIDIYEKSYFIFYLKNDFIEDNIDNLLDSLSLMEIILEIGMSDITKISLSFMYFIASYTDDELLLVNLDTIKREHESGMVLIESLKYSMLIKKLVASIDNKKPNRVLIVPINMAFFIKTIPLISMAYHGAFIKMSLDDETFKHSSKFISHQAMGIDGIMVDKKLDSSLRIISQASICMVSKVKIANIEQYAPMEKRILSVAGNYSQRFQYFTVIIKPDYSKIDPEMWSEVPNMIPEIDIVKYVISSDRYGHYKLDESGSSVREVSTDNADIRTSSTCTMYMFNANPDIPMQEWVNRTINENGDVLANIYKEFNKTHDKIKGLDTETGDFTQLNSYNPPMPLDEMKDFFGDDTSMDYSSMGNGSIGNAPMGSMGSMGSMGNTDEIDKYGYASEIGDSFGFKEYHEANTDVTISISLTPCQIPIIVTITTYKKNAVVNKDGMCGLSFCT